MHGGDEFKAMLFVTAVMMFCGLMFGASVAAMCGVSRWDGGLAGAFGVLVGVLAMSLAQEKR